MIKKCSGYLLLFMILLLFNSCSQKNSIKKYKIGFSQCTDDLYRKQMLADMKREMAFHPNVDFVFRDAMDNSQLQVKQVRELADEHIDLLIISPNEAQPLTSVVEDLFNKGIPVIIIDRKIASQLYTASIGADNTEIGRMAGDYAASLLHGKGNVIEIIGKPGSTPAIERQKGFQQSIEKYKNINLTTEVYANWLKDDAYTELSKIKNKLLTTDLVYAHNDVMAMGASGLCKELGIEHKVKIIGIDGVPSPGGGLDMVSNKVINATMLYPTGGQEAIQTAFKILNGEVFNKHNILQSLVIDSTNVHLMQLQSRKISQQQKDIEKQQELLEHQEAVYKGQTTFLYITIGALIIASFLTAIVLVAWRNNRKINRRLSLSNAEILSQKNQLVEMTAKAKEATEAKFNFFTSISHELRTPLTLIFAPLEDVLVNKNLNVTVKHNLEIVQKNAQHLLNIVNQLMDFRKIELNKMMLHATENKLGSFVKEIVKSFREIARKKDISIQLNMRHDNLLVWFDTNLLEKVLFNLLSNAIKFTKNQGYITITIDKSKDDKEAIIAVEDTGVGMTPEAVNHAFDLFYQERGTTFKGSGLGLSLSKELIDLHQGTISLQSEKWKGTRFEIHLPLGNTHLLPEQIKEQPSAKSENNEDIQLYIADNITPILAHEGDHSTDKEYSILIIEDNDQLRNFLKYRFSPNFEIYEADNATTAINLAFDIVPDLIICDIVLPGGNGFKITETLKSDVRSSHIPIIILTANSSIEKQITSLQLTADAFIPKPFNPSYLEETIKSLLKTRKQLREHYTSEASLEIKSASSKIDRKFINEFSAIVEKNIANDSFTGEDICKEINISRVQLNRKIKVLLGVNVNDYILNVRLQKARYLLNNEDVTIAEVAYKVGFSSPAYFSTVFKSKFEVTPSEFRSK